MPQIYFSEEELLALNEAVNHIDDHEVWMFDVMDGESLKSGINKINKKSSPIIQRMNEIERGEIDGSNGEDFGAAGATE